MVQYFPRTVFLMYEWACETRSRKQVLPWLHDSLQLWITMKRRGPTSCIPLMCRQLTPKELVLPCSSPSSFLSRQRHKHYQAQSGERFLGHGPLWNLLIEIKLEYFTLQNLVEDLSSSNTAISEKDVFSSRLLQKKKKSIFFGRIWSQRENSKDKRKG